MFNEQLVHYTHMVLNKDIILKYLYFELIDCITSWDRFSEGPPSKAVVLLIAEKRSLFYLASTHYLYNELQTNESVIILY